MFKTLFSLFAISLVFAACQPNAAINTANAQTPDYEFTVIVPLDEFVVKNKAKSDTMISLHTIMYATPNAHSCDAHGFYAALRKRKNQNWFADKNCTQPIKFDFRHCDTLLKDGKFFQAECSDGLEERDIVAYALRHIVKYNPATLFIKNSDIQARYDSIFEPLAQTLFAAAQQKKVKIYQPYVPYPSISEKAFAEMQIKRLDTVVTFNPETYEENMKIIESDGIKKADICGLVYNLLYSCDEKTFEFTTKIENIGLEEEHKDNNGKFMYKNTAFCVKPE